MAQVEFSRDALPDLVDAMVAVSFRYGSAIGSAGGINCAMYGLVGPDGDEQLPKAGASKQNLVNLRLLAVIAVLVFIIEHDRPGPVCLGFE